MSKRNKKQKKLQRQAELAARPTGASIVAQWPLYEVLLDAGWQDTANLARILVARQAPDASKVAVAYFLADLACLGLKSVQVKRFADLVEYEEFRTHVLTGPPMVQADLDLVAKILYTARDYASQLGFKPDFVFTQAEFLLSGAEPEHCPTPVPTGGPEGKPLYINGPYDDPDQIIATLRRTVGEDNFDYVIQAGPDTRFGFDDKA